MENSELKSAYYTRDFMVHMHSNPYLHKFMVCITYTRYTLRMHTDSRKHRHMCIILPWSYHAC